MIEGNQNSRTKELSKKTIKKLSKKNYQKKNFEAGFVKHSLRSAWYFIYSGKLGTSENRTHCIRNKSISYQVLLDYLAKYILHRRNECNFVAN